MNFLLIFLPLFFGYITSFFCNYSNLNNKDILPKWIFFIIWPILYLLLGYAWFRSNNISFWLILILNILLCSWLIINNCLKNQIISLLIILISQLIILYIIYNSDNINKILISPLFIWLLFASSLQLKLI
jgi:tryptophan-rich sensory protein